MAESQSSPQPSNQADVSQPQQPEAQTPPQQQSDSQHQPAETSSSRQASESRPSEQQPEQQPEQQQSSAPDSEHHTATPAADDDMTGTKPREDVVMGGTEADATNAASADPGAAPDSSADAEQGQAPEMSAAEAAAAAPLKKDTSLREFLGQMDEYAPIIPDAVTAHYLTVAGLPPPGTGPNQTPPHLARLLALATQKFVADVATDAYQYTRIRNSNSASNPTGAINVAAGLNVANQGQAGGGGGGAAGGGGGGGAGAGGGAGGGGAGESSKNKSANAGLHLGVQRAGFGGGGQGGGQGKTVLTMEDLGMAVSEYGMTVKRGEFYR